MQGTLKQIATLLGLSFGTMNTILSRPEFCKCKYGTFYRINKDFLDNLLEYIRIRRKSNRYLNEKYKLVEVKLCNWKKKLEEKNVEC